MRSLLRRDAAHYPNDGSYGEVYMYTDDGGATYQPSDAFIAIPER
jgi:hypothetical protein